VLSEVDVLIFSEEDVAHDEALVQEYASMARLAVVTRGYKGATLFRAGIARDFGAFRAHEVDPTGAGDVFAAAFLVRLHETGDPGAAATFANCAASLSIEGAGMGAVPDRHQVEERLLRGELDNRGTT
jgi:sugar/nucleoside kinase (ribokinase family)